MDKHLFFDRIQSASHPYLGVLLPLYLESFPPEERRAPNDLLRMLNVQEMNFSAIRIDDLVVGLVIYWKFKGFLYLEHLTVSRDQRKKGIGEEVLKQLQKEENPILLEVEIPYDDTSNRRVAFYNGAGFRALPVYYHQPPYREGESLLPMLLFSDRTNWDPDILENAIALFQHRVYAFQKD